ncbi:hypothetical protein D920_00087 [Enterococcus faecalis 13-SD-W-01]|nr:hypothetical protein D920_00087 [Enterococcus faecalis 13-SD-W-01]
MSKKYLFDKKREKFSTGVRRQYKKIKKSFLRIFFQQLSSDFYIMDHLNAR